MYEDAIRFMRKKCDEGCDVLPGPIRYTLSRVPKAECIALAGRLGIARRVTTKTEAVAAIVRWVRELPIAKQAISY